MVWAFSKSKCKCASTHADNQQAVPSPPHSHSCLTFRSFCDHILSSRMNSINNAISTKKKGTNIYSLCPWTKQFTASSQTTNVWRSYYHFATAALKQMFKSKFSSIFRININIVNPSDSSTIFKLIFRVKYVQPFNWGWRGSADLNKTCKTLPKYCKNFCS